MIGVNGLNLQDESPTPTKSAMTPENFRPHGSFWLGKKFRSIAATGARLVGIGRRRAQLSLSSYNAKQ
jgi:hypothetical protein